MKKPDRVCMCEEGPGIYVHIPDIGGEGSTFLFKREQIAMVSDEG